MEVQRETSHEVLDFATTQVTFKASLEIFLFHKIFVPIKLDYHNFTIRKHQVFKTLKSLDLEDYMLKDPVIETIPNGNPNAMFKSWRKQDSMFGCWLMSCMTYEILKKSIRF